MPGNDCHGSEDVASLVLGLLPHDIAARVHAHNDTCARCRKEYDEMLVVADVIGYTAERDEALSPKRIADLRERLLRSVRESSG
jgi:hypothetical protein